MLHLYSVLSILALDDEPDKGPMPEMGPGQKIAPKERPTPGEQPGRGGQSDRGGSRGGNCPNTCEPQSPAVNCVCEDNEQDQQEENYIPYEDQMEMENMNNQMDCMEQCAQNGSGMENPFGGTPGYAPPQQESFVPMSPQPQPRIPEMPKMTIAKTRVPMNATITIKDKMTAVVTSVVTSTVERPPITVTQAPQTVTFTKHERPVTKTLPPMVFQIPTTIIKTARPETIIKTLPPQVIYQPPITSTVHHQIEYPPSTVVLSTTIPPVTRTVMIPGPTKTLRFPPSTVVKVSTRVMPPRIVTVQRPSPPSIITIPVTVTSTQQVPVAMMPMPLIPQQPSPQQPSPQQPSPQQPMPQQPSPQQPMPQQPTPQESSPGYSGEPSPQQPQEGGNEIVCDCYPQENPQQQAPMRPKQDSACECPPQRQRPRQYPRPQPMPQLPMDGGDYDCTLENLNTCQDNQPKSQGNRCSRNKGDCYKSMMQSDYDTGSEGNTCNITNIQPCQEDKYPNVIDPSKPKSRSRSASSRPSTSITRGFENSSEDEGKASSLLAGDTAAPKVLYASELIGRLN